MGISEDRWTCPRCNRTIVLRSRGAGRDGLRAAQEKHAVEHGIGNQRLVTLSRRGDRPQRVRIDDRH